MGIEASAAPAVVDRRIGGNGKGGNVPWKCAAKDEVCGNEAGSDESGRASLLAGVKEHSCAAAHNGLPARIAAGQVSDSESWSEIVPSGLPGRRTLRRQDPGARIRSQQSKGSQSLRYTGRGIDLPP